jgi:6-phospho-3-hexuloisomerase
MSDQRGRMQAALDEIEQALLAMDETAVDRLVDQIRRARRIVVYGMGREMLCLRAFCMRLMHLGLDAHVAGDVTAKPVVPGDLVIVTAGPGDLAMVETMVDLAHEAGASVTVLTAQPNGRVPRKGDDVIEIPAQTMASDIGSDSILPMGTAFEIALFIYLDLAAIGLRQASGQSLADIRARHINLE